MQGVKKGWIIGGVVCVAAVTVVAACVSNLGNFVRRTFYSPEKYYQYIEKQEAIEAAGMAASVYDNLVRDNLNIADKKVSGTIRAELTKDSIQELEDLTDEDMSWLEKMEVEYEASAKDDVWSVSGSLGLKKGKVISGSAILDMQDETVYAQVPELTRKYIGVDFSDYYDIESYREICGVMEQVYEKSPDKKTVEKILYRYMCDAIECIDRVKKDRDILEAEDVAKNYTTLTARIDADTMADMAEAVLQDMQKDKELKKIIEDMAPVLEEELRYDGDVYDEFQDALDEALDDVDDMRDADMDLKMTIWVDSKGHVAGRRIQSEDAEMLFAMPKKGSRFGLEASYDDGYSKASLTGSGKQSGNKLSGEFKLKADGSRLAQIIVKDYDTEKIKSGFIDGQFTVQPSSQLLTDVMGSYTASLFSHMQFQMNVKTGKDAADIGVTLFAGDDAMATINMTAQSGKGSKSQIPSDSDVVFVEDESGLMEWMDSIDWKQFLSDLKKTGAPSDVIDEVEFMIEYLD